VRTDDIRKYVDQLELSREDQWPLIDALRNTQDQHGIRGAFAQPLFSTVDAAGHEALEKFHSFSKEFKRHGLFSWVPVDVFVLQLARVSTLLHPGRPLKEAIHTTIFGYGQKLKDITTLQTLILAAENDVGIFFKQSYTSSSFFQNFGVNDLEEVGRRSLVVHCSDTYPKAFLYFQPAFYDTIFDLFGVKGTQEYFDIGEKSFSTRLTWP